MDVTPNPGMLKAMEAFADACFGEKPGAKDFGPGAIKRRAQHRMAMDFLHNIVRLAMREGVGRHYREMGWHTVPDEIRPNPVKAAVSDAIGSDNIILPGH